MVRTFCHFELLSHQLSQCWLTIHNVQDVLNVATASQVSFLLVRPVLRLRLALQFVFLCTQVCFLEMALIVMHVLQPGLTCQKFIIVSTLQLRYQTFHKPSFALEICSSLAVLETFLYANNVQCAEAVEKATKIWVGWHDLWEASCDVFLGETTYIRGVLARLRAGCLVFMLALLHGI